jgi:hypothetical protein
MNKEEKDRETPVVSDNGPEKKVPGDYPEGKNKKGEDPLPPCRTAPDPEHQRAENDDEPCDDYRSGDVSTEDDA